METLGSVVRKTISSWGSVLAVILFIVLFIYGLVRIHSTIQGTPREALGYMTGVAIAVFVISAIVFWGIAAALAWLDARKAGGGK